MKKRKNRSLDLLLEGILEAENQMADSDAYDTQEYTSYLNNLLKEFLKKDNDLLRKQLLEDFERGAPLTGKNGIRKKLASFDMEFFGRAYLPHYFVRKSPHFHEELDNIWKHGVMKDEVPFQKAYKRKSAEWQVVKEQLQHLVVMQNQPTLHSKVHCMQHYMNISTTS